MTMTIEHWLILAAVALLAYHVGQAEAAKAAKSAPTEQADWWTFAGSWNQ